VLTQDPRTVTFSVENAGKARSRGVELDGMLLPTQWLTVVEALGFDDTEYLEYPFGSCVGDRVDTDGDGDARCDLKGEPLDRTPKWVISLTPSLRYPLTSIPLVGQVWSFTAGLHLTGSLTMEYRDVHFIDSERDPRVRQPAFLRLHGSIGFSDPDRGWSLGVTAQNLTNEYTRFISGNVPLASEVGSLFHMPDPPRLVFGTFRWVF
jgi:outer membrane receptor protein involved in Fe transport